MIASKQIAENYVETGRKKAEAIRDAEAFVIAAEATEAPAPASAMNIPAKKPSISI